MAAATDDNDKQAQVLNDLASFYASHGSFDFTPPGSPVKVTPPTSDSEQDPQAAVPEVQHNTVFNNIKSQDVVTRRRKAHPHNNRKQSSLAAAVKPTQERPRRRSTTKMDSSTHSTSTSRRGPRRSKSSDGMSGGSSHQSKSTTVDLEMPLKGGDDEKGMSALEKLKRRSTSRSVERKRTAPERSRSEDLVEMDRSRRGSSRDARRRPGRRTTHGGEGLESDASQVDDPDLVDEDIREKASAAMEANHAHDIQIPLKGGADEVESKQRSSSGDRRRRAPGRSKSDDLVEMDRSRRGSSRGAGRRRRNTQGEDNLAEDASKIEDPDHVDDDLKAMIDQAMTSSIPAGESSGHRRGPPGCSTSDEGNNEIEGSQRSMNGRRSKPSPASLIQSAGSEDDMTATLSRKDSPSKEMVTEIDNEKDSTDSSALRTKTQEGEEGNRTSQPFHRRSHRSSTSSSARTAQSNEESESKNRSRPSRSRGNSKWSAMKERSVSRSKSIEPPTKSQVAENNYAQVKPPTRRNSEAPPNLEAIAQKTYEPELKPSSDRILTKSSSDYGTSEIELALDQPDENKDKRTDASDGKDTSKPKSTLFKNLMSKSMNKKRQSNSAATESLGPKYGDSKQDEQIPGPTGDRTLTKSNSDSSVSDRGANDQTAISQETKKSATTIFKGLLGKSMGKKKTSQESPPDDAGKLLTSFSTEDEEGILSDAKKASRWKGLKSGMEFTSKLMKAAAEIPKKKTASEPTSELDTETSGTIEKQTEEEPPIQSKKSNMWNLAAGGGGEKEKDPAEELPLDYGLMMSVGSFSADAIDGLEEFHPEATIEEEAENDVLDEDDAMVDDGAVAATQSGPCLFSILEGSTPAPAEPAAVDRRSLMRTGLAAPSMRFDFDKKTEVVVNRTQPSIVEEEKEEETESNGEEDEELTYEDGNGDYASESASDNEKNDPVDRREYENDTDDSEYDSDYEATSFLSPMKFMQLKFKPSLSPSVGLGITIRSLAQEMQPEDSQDEIVRVHQMREEELDFEVESVSCSGKDSFSRIASAYSPTEEKEAQEPQPVVGGNEEEPSALEIEFERLGREILTSFSRTKAAREAVRRFQEEIMTKRKLYDEVERRRQDSLKGLTDHKINIDMT